ncbi:HAD family hydrolase [Alkaliphilus serpentinus]|uniref:HAD hydrolase-like protein n=1 Tax=Alkaliphilus serpentinus TaxID=1482731 RepID=A0A833M7L4_9FIRM|nr:HAD family hydrolase [Alkaliphilus serpentinus]KAB3528843.1 HAD hydrolase-like protein [Alkaliphilus serpentinus]
MIYQYILFDADDTLFDYTKAEVFALTSLLKDHDIECSDEILNSYRTINMQLWKEFEVGNVDMITLRTKRFERLIQEHSLSVKSDFQDFSQRYLQFLGEASFIIEGAIDICRYLFDKGFRLAIITNGIKEVQLNRIENSQLKVHQAYLMRRKEWKLLKSMM